MRAIKETPKAQKFIWLLPIVLVFLVVSFWLVQPFGGLWPVQGPYEPEAWPEDGFTYEPAARQGEHIYSVYQVEDGDILVPLSLPRSEEEAVPVLLELVSLLEAWFGAPGQEGEMEALVHPLDEPRQLLSLTLEESELLLSLDDVPSVLYDADNLHAPARRALHFLLVSQPYAAVEHVTLFAGSELRGAPHALVTHANVHLLDGADAENGSGSGAPGDQLTAYVPAAAGDRLYAVPVPLGEEVGVNAWIGRLMREYSAEHPSLTQAPPFFRSTPRLSITVTEGEAVVPMDARLDHDFVQDTAAAALFVDSLTATLLSHPGVTSVRLELTGDAAGVLAGAVLEHGEAAEQIWFNPITTSSE